MNDTATLAVRPPVQAAEHFDVLIVGAGISGIGGAYHLQQQCPGTSYVILEMQDNFGGTWWTHKYPGIRSDSDLYTFGYRFKPWVGPPIATAEEIRTYMGDVIAENGIGQHIRYHHRIGNASWSSATKRWTVQATNTQTGEAKAFTCNFLYMCQGYYNHDEGYTPEWAGMENFKGQIIHPMKWPEDLDYSGKKVVVIGSGATAATLIPAMAEKAGHITMLQRSPTFFRTGRNAIDIADELRKLKVDEMWVHEIVRRKITYEGAVFTQRCLDEPEKVREDLLGMVKAVLGEEFDIEKHFNPKYRPWQQRIAFIPDADLFKGIASGKASVVTDEIERFTQGGIELKSGEVLEADIIVTATGFHMSVMGGITFEVDGKPVDWSETITYRGMMFTGVPNLVWVFGYFRASWTLRADMVGDFVCRLLNHMKATGTQQVEVGLRDEDQDMKILPWIDEDNFNPNYLKRSIHLLPKRGDKKDWAHTQDYWNEKEEFPKLDLTDKAFHYA